MSRGLGWALVVVNLSSLIYMCLVLSFRGIRKFLQISMFLLRNLVFLGSLIASNGRFVVQWRIGTCVKLRGPPSIYGTSGCL